MSAFAGPFVMWSAPQAGGGGSVPPPPPPPPGLSVSVTGSLAEGGTMTATFSLSATSATAVTFDAAVSGVGASPLSAADFGGAWPAWTGISIAAGQLSATRTFAAADDAEVEPDEGGRISISNASGATIATASADFTVANNDIAPPPPAAFESIEPEGWSVNYPADIVGTDPLMQAVTVNRQGFDATGASTIQPVTVLATRRRVPNPTLIASIGGLMPRRVALSDYLYASDQVTGAVNSSLLVSPKPIVKWACLAQRVVGNSLYLAAAAAHLDAQLGRQVAAVRFIVSDSLGASVSVTVSAPTLTAHAGWVWQAPVWQATINISALADGALTANLEAFPHFGDASSVFKSADVPAASYWLARPLPFRKNVAKATNPPIAVVKFGGAGSIEGTTYGTPGDATGRVTTDPAEARAFPFATFGGAQAALVGATYAAITGQDMGGCEIWVAGTNPTPNPFDDGTARTTSGYELLIRRDPALSRAASAISSWSGRLRHNTITATELTAARVRFQGFSLGRDLASTHDSIMNTTLTSGAGVDVVADDCDIDVAGIPGTALLGSRARALILWGSRVLNDGGAVFTSRDTAALTQGAITFFGSRAEVAPGRPAVANLEAVTHIASEFVGYTTTGNQTSRGRWNSFLSWHSRYMRCGWNDSTIFGIDSDITDGIAWVNSLVEHSHGTARAFRISSDAGVSSIRHLVMHNLTLAGRGSTNGGMNMLYDNTVGTPRPHSYISIKGCVVQSLAWKGGHQFDPRADQIGHYAHGHGVGQRDNFIAGSTGFNRPYPGIGVLGSQDADNDPQFLGAAQWGPGGFGDASADGPGLGDYRPAPGSPLIGGSRNALTSHDLAGAPRPTTGDSIGAYL